MANTDWNILLSGAAAINRSGFLTALEKRTPYVVIAGENPASLTPGNVNVIVYGGVLFNYDSTDALTAHDGTTCIVTADGKRFKTDQFKGSNNALRNVKDKDLSTPPGSPTIGDRYIVKASGTGAWAAHDKQIAEYTARGWVFQVPNAYDVTMIVDEALYYHYSAGGAWTTGLPALTIADASISLKKMKNFPLGGSVENQTTNTPPGGPADGVAYIVAGAPTGAWVGHSLEVAIWESSSSAWLFFTGYEGARVYDKALNALYTHNGATWATTAAGKWLSIEEQTASASALLDFINLSGYRVLRLTINNLKPATDQVACQIRISSDNGSTFLATSTYSSSSGGAVSAARLTIVAGAGAVGNAAGDGGFSGQVLVLDLNIAQKTKFIGNAVWGDEGGATGTQILGWSQSAQTAMNAIRLMFSTGNITSGSAVLEGMI